MDAATLQMMADLGVARRDELSTTEIETRGRPARVDPREQARIRAEVKARQEEAQNNGTAGVGGFESRIGRWNIAESFDRDEVAEHLVDRFSGQGHRAELSRRQGTDEHRFQAGSGDVRIRGSGPMRGGLARDNPMRGGLGRGGPEREQPMRGGPVRSPAMRGGPSGGRHTRRDSARGGSVGGAPAFRELLSAPASMLRSIHADPTPFAPARRRSPQGRTPPTPAHAAAARRTSPQRRQPRPTARVATASDWSTSPSQSPPARAAAVRRPSPQRRPPAPPAPANRATPARRLSPQRRLPPAPTPRQRASAPSDSPWRGQEAPSASGEISPPKAVVDIWRAQALWHAANPGPKCNAHYAMFPGRAQYLGEARERLIGEALHLLKIGSAHVIQIYAETHPERKWLLECAAKAKEQIENNATEEERDRASQVDSKHRIFLDRGAAFFQPRPQRVVVQPSYQAMVGVKLADDGLYEEDLISFD
ncbi:uncharacterized protein LTR77_004598 [Saxophila tyrrhenica]|uniref:Uncharacterized protein n=1 Tax=Saxophila tyrrhenica TaxID=1690608 RepID=A0AAV9PEC2_9PEZI|nr:hypothetical protein LTR77_004598 [Saxophila tyrrhenica]